MTDLHRVDQLNSKQIVLALLSVSHDDIWPISRLVTATELFGIQAASLRVAVGRLVKEGTLESVGRGEYRIGEKGRRFRDMIRGWASQESLIQPWSGQWLFAHTAHLGRVDRKQVKARERALKLRGFAPMEQGLWVRPGNLVMTLSELRRQLIDIGVEKEAHFVSADALASEKAGNLPDLWDRSALEQRYQTLLKRMAQSQQNLEGMAIDAAARETLEVGLQVVTALNFDPLLPAEMIDSELRRRVSDAMVRYNIIGMDCWARFHRKTRARNSS